VREVSTYGNDASECNVAMLEMAVAEGCAEHGMGWRRFY